MLVAKWQPQLQPNRWLSRIRLQGTEEAKILDYHVHEELWICIVLPCSVQARIACNYHR